MPPTVSPHGTVRSAAELNELIRGLFRSRSADRLRPAERSQYEQWVAEWAAAVRFEAEWARAVRGEVVQAA